MTRTIKCGYCDGFVILISGAGLCNKCHRLHRVAECECGKETMTKDLMILCPACRQPVCSDPDWEAEEAKKVRKYYHGQEG